MFIYCFVADMGVDIPGRVKKHTYGNPKAHKTRPKHSKSVKKTKKPLQIHTKTSSPLGDEGKNKLVFL